MESDEDDGHGVVLEPSDYMSAGQPFMGDELYFTGYDLGMARAGRRSREASLGDMAYGEEYDYSEEEARAEEEEQQRLAYEQHQLAARAREEALVQAALDRIRKARSRGRGSVNLSQEELDALDRRKQAQQEARAQRTPLDKGSRSSSIASIASDKSRKKSGSRLFGVPSPSKPTSKGRNQKASRRVSTEQPPPAYQPNVAPPGILMAGPNGVPVYVPLSYIPPPSAEAPRSASTTSAKGSHSASSSSRRRQGTPPDPAYPAYTPRHYPPPPDPRPHPSPPARPPAPDSPLYLPRLRSASSAAQPHHPDAFVP
ncbi:Prenylated Rab acceptor 1, partial [Elasticomyces elasticus]